MKVLYVFLIAALLLSLVTLATPALTGVPDSTAYPVVALEHSDYPLFPLPIVAQCDPVDCPGGGC